MAIQLLRGTTAQIASNSNTSIAGQPLYDIDKHILYIGDGQTAINELEGIELGLDIENGDGVGSIRQRVSDNDAKNPVAYGLGAVAFGGFRGDKPNETPKALPGIAADIANIKDIVIQRYDGTTFKNIISDTTTYVEGIQATAIGAANRVYSNWSLAGGKDNVVIGKSGFAFGNGNVTVSPGYDKNAYSFSGVIGTSNTSISKCSFITGENNTNLGDHSFVAGQGQYNTGKYSVLLGGNTTSSTIPYRNYNRGNNNFFFGQGLNSKSDQFNKECSNVILLGSHLNATNDNQVIVGANSGFAVKGTPSLRFAVATGATPETGTNGFEVYDGGAVRVYKIPESDSEVARLKEIKELDTKITNGLEVERSVREAADTELDNKINTKKNKSDFIYEDGVLTILI